MSLINDFKLRFPEFDSSAIDESWPGIESLWPNLYNTEYVAGNSEAEAIFNLIGHIFTVDQNSGPALLSSSKSVGSVSVTKVVGQNMSARQSFLNSTKYGQRFFLLTQHRHGAHFV